jgi:hypothetical protein
MTEQQYDINLKETTSEYNAYDSYIISLVQQTQR